ncbi:MAG: hypothetical protein K2N60_06645 [Oscillospiraceae bacterium]|nr:hypothetical protein [Oscillospiraceae bacterium]
MPIVGTPYKRDEFYCPVCGYKYESKPYFSGFWQPVTITQKLIETIMDLKTRYVNVECCQCKTKLIYDRKKETIKIKK